MMLSRRDPGDDGRRAENSFFIRPAMDDGGKHATDDRLAGFPGVKSDSTANSAHRVGPAFRSRNE